MKNQSDSYFLRFWRAVHAWRISVFRLKYTRAHQSQPVSQPNGESSSDNNQNTHFEIAKNICEHVISIIIELLVFIGAIAGGDGGDSSTAHRSLQSPQCSGLSFTGRK